MKGVTRQGTSLDRPVKRQYLALLKETEVKYRAEMDEARRQCESRRLQGVAEAKQWLKEQNDPNAFQQVGRSPKNPMRPPTPSGIESVQVMSKRSWSGSRPVSLAKV